MRLFPHKNSPRPRKLLSLEEMNTISANNDHQRNESFKKAQSNIRLSMLWVGVAAIPIIYIVLVFVNWGNESTRNDWLQKGLVGVVSFVIGKANLFPDDKDKS